MFIATVPAVGEDTSHLPAFDFTKLSAVNTCPKWGVIRYGHHKTFATKNRAMALEAGESCHQVFSAVRCADLFLYGEQLYGPEIKARAVKHMHRLFDRRLPSGLLDTHRTDGWVTRLTDHNEDERTNLIVSSLYILETTGYVDDPYDKRRTLDKLSEAIIAYVDRYEFGVSLPYVTENFVGIEVPFDLLVTYRTSENTPIRKCRFYGRVDGVHAFRNDLTNPIIEENKTASRINDAWEMSFEMSHQVTGYIASAAANIGHPINMARIRGLSIPQPRMHDGNGVVNITVTRREHQFQQWAEWFMHTADLFFEYIDKPIDSPTYTVACNRYFRPCSFIPLCASPYDEQVAMFNDDMVIDAWSPLDEKSSD